MNELKKLDCMSCRCDGAHWGVSDWYPEIEQGIQDALNKGPAHEWTTGWYGSKKEIASACVTHRNGEILLEVGVSDDFDTEGRGEVVIPHTTDIEVVREKLDEAFDAACEDKKDNEVYAGFSVLRDGHWVETLLLPIGWGGEMDAPPGDYYHQWGFQGESEVSDEVKESLQAWAWKWVYEDVDGATEFTHDGWTVKPW